MNTHIFSVKNWKAGYDSQVIVQVDSLQLLEKSTLVILGKSGSGKTTLLRSFSGLLAPISGQMLYQDVDPYSLPIWKRKLLFRSFGFVFQEAALLDSLTTWENLILPLKRKGVPKQKWREQVVELMKAVELEEEVLKKYPAELSGGMKRRVGVARILALMPEVAFFDEPTMGLDPITSKKIVALLSEISRRVRLCFISTHDLRIPAVVGDLMLLLQGGEIISYVERKQWDRLREKGTPENHSEEVILRFIAGLPPV